MSYYLNLPPQAAFLQNNVNGGRLARQQPLSERLIGSSCLAALINLVHTAKLAAIGRRQRRFSHGMRTCCRATNSQQLSAEHFSMAPRKRPERRWLSDPRTREKQRCWLHSTRSSGSDSSGCTSPSAGRSTVNSSAGTLPIK